MSCRSNTRSYMLHLKKKNKPFWKVGMIIRTSNFVIIKICLWNIPQRNVCLTDRVISIIGTTRNLPNSSLWHPAWHCFVCCGILQRFVSEIGLSSERKRYTCLAMSAVGAKTPRRQKGVVLENVVRGCINKTGWVCSHFSVLGSEGNEFTPKVSILKTPLAISPTHSFNYTKVSS